jgi:hypothetical protein
VACGPASSSPSADGAAASPAPAADPPNEAAAAPAALSRGLSALDWDAWGLASAPVAPSASDATPAVAAATPDAPLGNVFAAALSAEPAAAPPLVFDAPAAAPSADTGDASFF